jgi:hypothetical protein
MEFSSYLVLLKILSLSVWLEVLEVVENLGHYDIDEIMDLESTT